MTNKIDEIGTHIRKLRKEKKLTIAKLSEMSGVSGTFISQVENGQRNPSPEILGKLAEPLGVSKNSLLVVSGHIENDELAELSAHIQINHQALYAAEQLIVDLRTKLKNLSTSDKSYRYIEDELKKYEEKRNNFIETLKELNHHYSLLLSAKVLKEQTDTVKQHINLNDDNEGNFVFFKNNKELPDEIQKKLRALIKLTLD